MISEGHYLRVLDARSDVEEANRRAELAKREATELRRSLEEGFGEEGSGAVRTAEVKALRDSMEGLNALLRAAESKAERKTKAESDRANRAESELRAAQEAVAGYPLVMETVSTLEGEVERLNETLDASKEEVNATYEALTISQQQKAHAIAEAKSEFENLASDLKKQIHEAQEKYEKEKSVSSPLRASVCELKEELRLTREMSASTGGADLAGLLDRVQKAEERAEKAELDACYPNGKARKEGGAPPILVERLQRELDFAYKQKSTLEGRLKALEAESQSAQDRAMIAEATMDELAQARAEEEEITRDQTETQMHKMREEWKFACSQVAGLEQKLAASEERALSLHLCYERAVSSFSLLLADRAIGARKAHDRHLGSPLAPPEDVDGVDGVRVMEDVDGVDGEDGTTGIEAGGAAVSTPSLPSGASDNDYNAMESSMRSNLDRYGGGGTPARGIHGLQPALQEARNAVIIERKRADILAKERESRLQAAEDAVEQGGEEMRAKFACQMSQIEKDRAYACKQVAHTSI